MSLARVARFISNLSGAQTDLEYNMPLSEPKARSPLHTRTITIDAFFREDGLTDIEATLVDTKPVQFRLGVDRPYVAAGEAIHRISVRLSVDASGTIHETEVAMDASPYHCCKEVEMKFQLNGVQLGAGFLKAVRERIGTEGNCWHASQLLPQMATVLVQANYLAMRERIDRLPSDQRPAPAMLNSCVGWQDHRVHVQKDFPKFYREKRSPDQKDRPRTGPEDELPT
ncbi:DUF2889 domain-containing protein [Caballeronia zhejiangensis]|uniref:DUF2889 domain-containing protein n=1 Tax=Caballeronia zhejiangensis TaxID=871203 RepID=UPI001EF62F5C|nr:DUF2889 domain-containing protein [Caballeronia zhejiangensis]MCG7400282.1 DUF2889 domain-containing protein [Caballeronia zhejiangensis]